MSFKTTIKHWYEKKYKLLTLFSFLIVVLAFVQISVQYATTGDFVHRGISLKGGSTITIPALQGTTITDLEHFLQQEYPGQEIALRSLSSVGGMVGLAIDTPFETSEDIDMFITVLSKKIPLQEGRYSIEIVGTSLGESFFRQTLFALLVAFLLMGIVVLLYFRLLIPSVAVILAAVSDITVTLAIFNLTGMPLNTAGIAAFLMLVGFSVDTDVLLTTRVLKRQDGPLMERIYGAVKTGTTMTTTTLAAVIVTMIFTSSDVIRQIMLILCIGLLVDMIMTWIQNVGLLRLYLERVKK